ncbi:MAG: hypothetical protein AAB774_01470 [Patescibacteria group bacterium]
MVNVSLQQPTRPRPLTVRGVRSLRRKLTSHVFNKRQEVEKNLEGAIIQRTGIDSESDLIEREYADSAAVRSMEILTRERNLLSSLLNTLEDIGYSTTRSRTVALGSIVEVDVEGEISLVMLLSAQGGPVGGFSLNIGSIELMFVSVSCGGDCGGSPKGSCLGDAIIGQYKGSEVTYKSQNGLSVTAKILQIF